MEWQLLATMMLLSNAQELPGQRLRSYLINGTNHPTGFTWSSKNQKTNTFNLNRRWLKKTPGSHSNHSVAMENEKCESKDSTTPPGAETFHLKTRIDYYIMTFGMER